MSWACAGIPPNIPPCGAHGDREGGGKGTAERHTKDTGHATYSALLPGTLRLLLMETP